MKKHYGTPYYGVLNGRQLALKVTANSVYGFTGAQKGFLPEPRIASSVTKYGRGLTLRTMDMVDNNPAWKGSKVIYGDSVSHDTPLLLRVRGKLVTSTIEDVAEKDGAQWETYGDKNEPRSPRRGVVRRQGYVSLDKSPLRGRTPDPKTNVPRVFDRWIC